MLKIRLARYGKRQHPHYRIVVMEARSRRQGKPVATLGYWNPGDGELKFDKKAYGEWQVKGARPTEAVEILAKKKEGK